MFFSLRLREEAGATNTLSSVIVACRAQLEADADSLNRFEKGLAKVGYSPAHEEEYAKMRLRVVEEGIFQVRNDFRRLTASHLTAGVPPGVEGMEYEINLRGFDHLCIASRASDAHDFL